MPFDEDVKKTSGKVALLSCVKIFSFNFTLSWFQNILTVFHNDFYMSVSHVKVKKFVATDGDRN